MIDDTTRDKLKALALMLASAAREEKREALQAALVTGASELDVILHDDLSETLALVDDKDTWEREAEEDRLDDQYERENRR